MRRPQFGFLYFFILILENVEAELSPDGEHVCLFEERYIKTIQVREMIPVKVTKMQWCWKIPPRCPVNETEMRPQLVDKVHGRRPGKGECGNTSVMSPRLEVPRTRIVAKCCKGYAPDIAEKKCVPVCSDPCVHGVCIAPDKCSCESGYFGFQCTKQCLPGYWGRGCVEKCECVNGGICGTVNGECNCLPGWHGFRCEYVCDPGYYGYNCNHRCDCHGASCNPETGTCVVVTTTTETETTTVTTTTTELPTTTIFVTTQDFETEVSTIQSVEITRVTDSLITTTEETFPFGPVNVTQLADENEENKTIEKVTEETTMSNEIEISPNKNINTFVVTSQRDNKISILNSIPSLSLVSAGAVLIFVITMGSVMFNHYRKIKKMTKKKNETVKISATDLGIHKFYGESSLPVTTIFENPVYSSEIELENEQPTLQSFKPLPLPITEEESQQPNHFVSRETEVNYDRPPSNRSSSNEHLYQEISVITNYDVPKRNSLYRTIINSNSS